MRSGILMVLLVATIAAVPAGAQEVSSTQVFPAAAHIAGVPPSQWVSDVVVNNLNDYEIVVGFQFFPENQAHTFFDLTFDDQITLAARETRLFEDVLATLLGHTEDIKGALIVTCEPEFLPSSGNPEDSKILATMRTYDVSSPVGTYGQTIPSTEEVDNSTGSFSYLTGARNDGQFRSNLGIINLSLEETTVHYRIMRSDATVVVEGSKTMGSLSGGQWSFGSLGVGTVEGPLTIDLWFDPSSVSDDLCGDFPNSFLAYVSKVDGDSQDGEFIYAAPGAFAHCEDDNIDGNDYYPIDIGNVWNYNISDVEVIDDPHAFADGIGQRMNTTRIPGPDVNVDFFDNMINNGVVYFGSYAGGVFEDDPVDGLFVILKNTMTVDDTWNLEFIAPSSSSATISFLGLETVTVPAGSFADCIKIEFTFNDEEPYTDHLYFAQDVGLVKAERISPPGHTDGWFILVTSSDRLAELQSATINGVSYP